MPKRYREIGKWTLLPRPQTKETPSFIPEPIRESYYQACVIADVSPRAAAALARFCLQKMIRDFWKIPKDRCGSLASELDHIAQRIPAESKHSIELVRKFGNIDAYMREHIDKLVDATAKEVELLIRLNEILFEDWYVARYNRERRSDELDSFIKSMDVQPLQLDTVMSLPTKDRVQKRADTQAAPAS